MRCIACDKILTDYELTKKFDKSGEFADLCNNCSKYLSEDHITVFGNTDLASLVDLEEDNYVEDGTLGFGPTDEEGGDDDWT